MEESKHSGLGIASFVLSLLSGFSIFALVVVSALLEAANPGAMNEESPIAVAVGLMLFFLLGLCLLAIGLGIGGMFQGSRKKIFCILGTAFSALTFFATVLLVLVGIMLG